MLLELESVSVVRGSTTLLGNVSIAIPYGEHCAILGPNGSGKSTLLKLLMKHMYPSVVDGRAGIVRVLGQENWNVWELRSNLGYVSSEIDHHFMLGRSGRLTAMQAVLTGFFSSELLPEPDQITDDMKCATHEALELVNMAHMCSSPLGHMSTGERRRVMLARALAMRPKALILDEPTSGLDLNAQRELVITLEQLAVQGTTMIMVTHHFEEVLPCIERTILLERGQVFFDGSTREALESDRVSQLFNTAIDVSRSEDGYYSARVGCSQRRRES